MMAPAQGGLGELLEPLIAFSGSDQFECAARCSATVSAELFLRRRNV
jgi:hypothetical protein